MAHVDQLANYFGNTRGKSPADQLIGAEIETFFADRDGAAISIETSQSIMRDLAAGTWNIADRKGEMITVLHRDGSRILYELGYPNLELAVRPERRSQIIADTRQLLGELYGAAERYGASPVFAPMFTSEKSYLAVPDDRDATWLRLDGKKALSPLACISAVQFTIDVDVESATEALNKLNAVRDRFLADYPQDKVWVEYVQTSPAGYLGDRYGGPDTFDSLGHYCLQLSRHAVVQGSTLVPFEQADLNTNRAIELFIRSVWWYFRLRRYGANLCIEVRPLPRRHDEKLDDQLSQVLDTVK